VTFVLGALAQRLNHAAALSPKTHTNVHMTLFLLSFTAALLGTWLIVRSAHYHQRFSGDTDQSGPQKFHARAVPRVGGVGIALGLSVGVAYAYMIPGADAQLKAVLCAAGAIAFGGGLLEDFTKRVTPRQRMLLMVLAASVTVWLADVRITKSDIVGLDTLLTFAPFAIGLTLLTVAGVANSINIIDGFNGLASMCVAIMLASLAVVAYQVGDQTIFNLALVGLGAVLGFFVLNYPLGLIFLGDGGAYFMGFWVAELSLLLVQRNASVSPMFPLLLCSYPIFETVFTMYRRKVLRGRPVGQPDATHLHSLIYRRLIRWALGRKEASVMLRRNSMTAPYLWALCSMGAVPAMIWWNNSGVLQLCIVLFCVVYILLYRAIVRFQTPRILVQNTPLAPAMESAG
jgi:UDP-N-acetylmuramyl pentapeptide phosphotransferase/UDP-N-acetylglucosamine-1-phosphate transferase